MVQNHRLVLASGSPRRKELLGALDLDFEIDSKTAFEELYPEDLPVEKVPLYLAEGKSQFFHRELAEDEILITADTVVIVDGKLLGKPHSKAEEELIPPALGTLLAIRQSNPASNFNPRFFMQHKMPFKKFA